MKMKLLCLVSLVSFHETILVFAVQDPVSSPISSPFFPGMQTEEHTKMSFSKKMLLALSVAFSSLAAIISVLFCLWICYKKNSLKPIKNDAKSSDAEKGITLAPFLGYFKSMKMVSEEGFASFKDYKILAEATNKFHQTNILGIGGFGCVYKAQFVDGSCAAVKKLDCSSHDAEKEFQNEVDLLSKFKHSNIISLLDSSSYNETRFIVYELMHNGSLETQLHGPSHGSSLTWHRRMKIAMDIARGLEYLHEHCNPPVIHRDLKSSNILLDSDFNAKLSDFGLAVTDAAKNKNNLKLSGTLGYVAPEYLLDDKSDVYAFGIVLLELLLGRKPVEKVAPAQCISIITWAMPKLTDRSQLPNIVDPVIKNTMDLKHLYQVAAVAVLCVQPEPSYRPLITDVLHSLIPLVPTELGGALRVRQSLVP
ncbi:hypothetical protein like AT2G25220 [Hibiscus trionum]|uniref:Protein kinase domain-containing protein n=1 Tax=Hibiscus trionum TaxID=183268 RepID=A0A9W7J9L5_HIBTR|nr:hypothetical protein like AT2G25220 [Hibiscus trionum]